MVSETGIPVGSSDIAILSKTSTPNSLRKGGTSRTQFIIPVSTMLIEPKFENPLIYLHT